VAVRPAALVSDEKRIRGVYARCATLYKLTPLPFTFLGCCAAFVLQITNELTAWQTCAKPYAGFFLDVHSYRLSDDGHASYDAW